MNLSKRDLLTIKAELLCFGIRLEGKTAAKLVTYNSYVLDGGFIHAAHFLIDDVLVNTCVSEEFCSKSPYSIEELNGSLYLLKNSSIVTKINILSEPSWCTEVVDDITIGDVLRPHSLNCISCWPKTSCDYGSEDIRCKFCSLCSSDLHDSVPPPIIGKMVKKATSYNKDYEINLSGGTCNQPDKSADYLASVCSEIRKYSNNYISVELAPPDSLYYIQKLYDNGASSIIMNLEIYDDKLRRKICPGKSTITKERYYEAFKESVNIFGRGKVSSVLLAGIQKEEDIKEASMKMVSIGVIPTIIPFKPLDNCLMKNWEVTDPEQLLRISDFISEKLIVNNLVPHEQKGCTNCGGCSLESLYF